MPRNTRLHTPRSSRLGAILSTACALFVVANLPAAEPVGRPSMADSSSSVRVDQPGSGALGGAAAADFDELIELIQTTVEPTTWDDVGGPGAISEYATGVYVDAQGVLRTLIKDDLIGPLARLHAIGHPGGQSEDIRRASPMRMVSLPRLEEEVQRRLAQGSVPTRSMQTLAGMQRVQYVFVYPETGDLVLAGPAGDWSQDWQGRFVSTESGTPVVRLDDLVVVFRHMATTPDARFGCTITPTTEALARAQAFLDEWGESPLRQGGRSAWIEQLRSRLGKQEIEVQGLPPGTRAARVMIEADYRMKLVGMGLEQGVPGVESYLDLVKKSRLLPESMDVLRWWFTLNYDAVLTSENRTTFAIRGQGVKVLSENELLGQLGERIHTGHSDDVNRRFADTFTLYFDRMCAVEPVYAELRNLCDLALVAAIIRQSDLYEQVNWHPSCFATDGTYPVQLGRTPQRVETVVNDQDIRPGEFLVGVSGGVHINPTVLARPDSLEIDRYHKLDEKRSAASKTRPQMAWWWDL